MKAFVGGILGTILGTLLGIYLPQYVGPHGAFDVTILEAVETPYKGKLQLLVIQSTGNKPAMNVRVKIRYRRVFRSLPFDYRITSLDTPQNVSRSDSQLQFDVARAVPGSAVIVALAVNDSEVTRNDVDITHDEGDGVVPLGRFKMVWASRLPKLPYEQDRGVFK